MCSPSKIVSGPNYYRPTVESFRGPVLVELNHVDRGTLEALGGPHSSSLGYVDEEVLPTLNRVKFVQFRVDQHTHYVLIPGRRGREDRGNISRDCISRGKD